MTGAGVVKTLSFFFFSQLRRPVGVRFFVQLSFFLRKSREEVGGELGGGGREYVSKLSLSSLLQPIRCFTGKYG
jgi:hypothetical protein